MPARLAAFCKSPSSVASGALLPDCLLKIGSIVCRKGISTRQRQNVADALAHRLIALKEECRVPRVKQRSAGFPAASTACGAHLPAERWQFPGPIQPERRRPVPLGRRGPCPHIGWL